MLPSLAETGGRIMICPSILAADFAQLGEDVKCIADAADMIHFDVMDGSYVPNISFGPCVAEALRPVTELPLDVHLMVERPEDWLLPFSEAGADLIVIHQEAATHGHRVLQQIKSLGCATGMALNPGTPILVLEEYLPYLDLILLMTVNPGFGGQSFIPSMLDKIRRTKEMIDESGYPIHLQVDGGINVTTIADVAEAGCDMIVAGSAVFGQADPALAIRRLRDLAESGRAKRIAQA